jgi:hypothetical protein
VTALRMSKIAGGVAIVTVAAITAMVGWSLLHPSDPDASLQHTGGAVLGDMTGYVGRVDQDTRSVDVSTSLLGVRPVMLLVTNDTAILVRGKQGGLGDLGRDTPVRVFYEVRNDIRYATSIQVITEDGQASTPPVTASAPKPMPPADTAAAKPTPPAPAATPKRAAPGEAPAAKPTQAVTASAAKPMPPMEAAAPKPVASVQVAAPAPAKPATPAEVVSAAPPAARPADADAEDGSSAIDWLLKESRRR